MKKLIVVIVAFMVVFGSPLLSAQENTAAENAAPEKESARDVFERIVNFNAVIQSVFYYRNDSDFDGTRPFYNEDGQSVGLLGTFFAPKLELKPIEEIRIYYEAEIGLNLWSRNDPAQYSSGEKSAFQLAHREIYAEGHFVDNLVGFKVGYQKFYDPSGLFLGHWIGAASFISDPGWARFTLSAGQLPDQTYEGVTLDSNNFKHDTLVYGLRTDVPHKEWLFTIWMYGLNDSQIVDQTANIVTPGFSFSADYKWVNFGLDLALQAGKTTNAAADGDEKTFAYALQAFADFSYYGFGTHLSQLILSADDKHDHNGNNGAFYYSGKSRSRTIMLSEDEIRDKGGNLDEMIAARRGQFYLARSGYSLTDLAFSYNVKDIFVPALIVGAGFALESDNALAGVMVGVETDLDMEIKYKDILSFHLIGGILFPGGAAAAYVNQYDRKATNNQYMVETSLGVFF